MQRRLLDRTSKEADPRQEVRPSLGRMRPWLEQRPIGWTLAGSHGGRVLYDHHRPVAAARLSREAHVLTLLYADGGSTSATGVGLGAADDVATELGLTPGGTSLDIVRFWWR